MMGCVKSVVVGVVGVEEKVNLLMKKEFERCNQTSDKEEEVSALYR